MKKSEKPKETLGSRLSESRSLSERYAEVLELREMNDAFSRVFTIEVDSRPTLAFEATGHFEARRRAGDHKRKVLRLANDAQQNRQKRTGARVQRALLRA
jgi:hypothetical protein